MPPSPAYFAFTLLGQSQTLAKPKDIKTVLLCSMTSNQLSSISLISKDFSPVRKKCTSCHPIVLFLPLFLICRNLRLGLSYSAIAAKLMDAKDQAIECRQVRKSWEKESTENSRKEEISRRKFSDDQDSRRVIRKFVGSQIAISNAGEGTLPKRESILTPTWSGRLLVPCLPSIMSVLV